MKLLKSFKQIEEKFKGGKKKVASKMSDDEAGSYEGYDHVNCTGTEDKILLNGEDYYRWVFYSETPLTIEEHPEHIKKNLAGGKRKKFRFNDDMEQERYEWFCGGWVQFYDDILRPEKELGGKLHKLFFFWDRKDVEGVAIYINDARVQDQAYNIQLEYKGNQLIYTAPTATSDPPTVPPPPPPSKT